MGKRLSKYWVSREYGCSGKQDQESLVRYLAHALRKASSLKPAGMASRLKMPAKDSGLASEGRSEAEFLY